MFVIGLDFGNFYSQPYVIKDMDLETRRGGICINLQDTAAIDPNGVPSAFFYSAKKNKGNPLIGYSAVDVKPYGNCKRYLKRHIKPGEEVTIDDRTFKYEDMIVDVIQYCVRMANAQLLEKEQETTNKIALAYPATYDPAYVLRLVELAQRATTADGRHIEVVGTAAEPAAAALHYLANQSADKETTVLTYDMGAGTFDISIVKAYPSGKQDSAGNTYYYDVCDTDGSDLYGGAMFDQLIFDIMAQKAGVTPKGMQKDTFTREAEVTKRKLTYATEYEPDLGDIEIEITKDEFEAAAKPLVEKTIEMVNKMINNSKNPKPDIILLTGGGSRMPIVKRMMEESFPGYRIQTLDPSYAISYGVARFGVPENKGSNNIKQRATRDVGVRYVSDENDEKGHITVFIPAGTELPFTSEPLVSGTATACRYSDFSVYINTVDNPDRFEVNRDYRKIMDNTYDHGRVVEKNTKSSARLIIDEKSLLHIEVTDPNDPTKPPYTNEVTLYFD